LQPSSTPQAVFGKASKLTAGSPSGSAGASEGTPLLASSKALAPAPEPTPFRFDAELGVFIVLGLAIMNHAGAMIAVRKASS
jgi:hypothetical protein